MLAGPRHGSHSFVFSTSDTGAAINVTPGVGSKGSWTQLAASSDISKDSDWLMIGMGGGGVNTATRSTVMDIGIDPAGGTSYSVVIADIGCSQSATFSTGALWFEFPFRVPAGASVAARANSSSGGDVGVQAFFIGGRSHPFAHRSATYSETIGASGSVGASLTSGASGTEGSWALVGTTTRDLWWWQTCFGLNNNNTTAQTYSVDLAYGDGTNFTLIQQNSRFVVPGTTETMHHNLNPFGYCEVPAGSSIYARATSSGGSPNSGANVIAIGIGG